MYPVGVAALTQLQSLTQLTLDRLYDPQCISLAKLTGLLELELESTQTLSVVGWRKLAALTQWTSLSFYRPDHNSKLSRVLWQVSEKVPVNIKEESAALLGGGGGILLLLTVITNKVRRQSRLVLCGFLVSLQKVLLVTMQACFAFSSKGRLAALATFVWLWGTCDLCSATCCHCRLTNTAALPSR
jgi:hypothetical protein